MGTTMIHTLHHDLAVVASGCATLLIL